MPSTDDFFEEQKVLTSVKLSLFERYADIWFAVLTRSQFNALYIVDGFAGPGPMVTATLGVPLGFSNVSRANSHGSRGDVISAFSFVLWR